MNHNTVNVAIQVLPSSKEIHPYNIVDRAIELIQESGLKFKVCPFETVVEGKMSEILLLVEKMHKVCYDSGADSMMMYLKIQTNKDNDVRIEDKMKKYE